MSNLSNVDIERYISEGLIEINPYDSNNIQGATIDLRLGSSFLIPKYYGSRGKNALELDEDLEYFEISNNEITVLPHHFILGTTLENLVLPNSISARVDGKSKIGRKGLIVQTAGHIGPGFTGEITLELYNANQIPIVIRKEQKICQVEFSELKTPSTKPYSGRFMGQKGARA